MIPSRGKECVGELARLANELAVGKCRRPVVGGRSELVSGILLTSLITGLSAVAAVKPHCLWTDASLSCLDEKEKITVF